MKSLKFVSIIMFSLLFVSSFAYILPVNSAQSSQQTPSSVSWISAGVFLNYSVNANLGVSLGLSNGSSMSFTLNFTGSDKEVINSVSGSEASITSTPNLNLNEKLTYLNGTAKSHTETFTSINASTENIPIDHLNFGSVLQQALNNVSSSAYFSPSLNTTLSNTPAMFFQLNSTTKVAALHLSSTLTEKSTIPSQAGTSGSFSINGTADSFTTLAQGIPLKETVSLKGSASVQNVALLNGGLGGTARGNFDLTVALVDTNIALSSSNMDQSVIEIPNYSTQIDVVSNSTITDASTSGNQLIVNVTGPSGTTGVLNIVLSPSLLENAGIANPSEVGVTIDGQTYTNYTVTNLGGSYLFTIYYHHSSHDIVLSFLNANLGTNKGSISSLSPTATSAISTTLIEIAAAVSVIIVIVVVLSIMRSSRSKKMSSAVPPSPITQ